MTEHFDPVSAHVDPSTDLTQFRRLFKDTHPVAGFQQKRRCREASDAGAGDQDFGLY